MVKRFLAVMVALILICSWSAELRAEDESFTLSMTLNDPFMYVNGERQEIDPGLGTVPLSIDGRTFVPIRAVVQAMGGTVDFDSATSMITLEANGHTVLMWLGKLDIMVDDQAKTMDVAPQAINGRTQVPLRFAAENLGYDIAWEGTTNGITITTTVPPEVTLNLPGSSTTPPPTQPAPEQSTTVTATQPVTSGGQGQVGALTAGIFSIMESETYHMKVYMEVEGESFTTDTYYKNGQMASLLEVDGMRAGWTIFKDITMYVIMEEEDLVMVMALDESLTAPDAYQDTEELVFIGSGTTEFNGKNSPYDEYRTADGTQIFYFVESSKLIGIRMIAEGETFDMIILAFDQEIPTWVFEVPSGMNMIDYAELLAGAFGW